MPRLTLLESLSGVTEDDTGWVHIGRGQQDAIEPVKIEQSLRQHRVGYYTNSVLHLLVDTQADFLTGDPLIPLCPGNKEANDWLRAYWAEEVLPLLDEAARELICTSELLWIVDSSSAPEVVPLSPALISGCETLKKNPRKIARLSLYHTDDGVEEIVPLFGFSGPEDERVAAFLAVNKFGDALRGTPTLTHLLDPANVFDRANVAMLSRLPALYAIWWDVTLKGFTPDQVRKWEQEQGGSVPPPGTIIAHNDSTEWEVKSAAGTARTTADWYSYYRDFLLTSGGLSPTLFAGASYRYSEANSPTFRALRRLKKQFARFLRQVGALLVKAAGYPDVKVQVPITDPSPADLSRITTAVDRFISAITKAAEGEWISSEEARALILRMLKEQGLWSEGVPIETSVSMSLF